MSWTLDRRREARPRDPFRPVPPPWKPSAPPREFDDRVRRYDVKSGCFLLVEVGERRMWELENEHRELVVRYGHCLVEEARIEADRRGLSVRE